MKPDDLEAALKLRDRLREAETLCEAILAAEPKQQVRLTLHDAPLTNAPNGFPPIKQHIVLDDAAAAIAVKACHVLVNKLKALGVEVENRFTFPDNGAEKR